MGMFSNQNSVLNNGVMLNAYPDSIGNNLSDMVAVLSLPEFKDAFSYFYILPTFFNSDLDRGFSIIDYNINHLLVSPQDIVSLRNLHIDLKFDIVLNHLSVASPQFQDMITFGDQSIYKDFFINWNDFWKDNGNRNDDGIIVPHKEFLDKLFMRKSGLPILKVFFPDGTERPYWNTFYQKISFNKINIDEAKYLCHNNEINANKLVDFINKAIDSGLDLSEIDFGDLSKYKDRALMHLNKNKSYLGQMDVNASSTLVWEYYADVLKKLSGYGAKIVRLDAFAYLHKEVGETNFFNKPGTWVYLSKINDLALKYDLILLPEIHAEYGLHLHDEVAKEGYMIYDFFLPGLLIHTLEKGNNTALVSWGKELINKGYKTVNMLGCHDGIPVLDLKGKEINGEYHNGLLSDEEIEDVMNIILSRGGKVKNLYGADGKKISYYQVNATYFSALGEDEKKMLLARAIQLFMPGIPQVWYLDVFAGKNDYAAVEKAGKDGHKEINRTNLRMEDIKIGLSKQIVVKQLELIRFRNTFLAFRGNVAFLPCEKNEIKIKWTLDNAFALLEANLITYDYTITTSI
jgi:sucrose phosphorylase